MALQSIAVLLAHLAYLMICLISGYIIRSYLYSKPLGMQTGLDKVIYHFTYSHTLATTSGTVILGVFELIGPTSDLVAKIATIAAYIIALIDLFAACAVLIIRYLNQYLT